MTGTRIVSSRDGDRLLITLQGTLDATSVTALQSQLVDLAQVHDVLGLAGPVRQIHIDLAGVDFCDVAGVRMLVAARRVADARAATGHLHDPPPHLSWLLRATRADGLFHLHESDTCQRPPSISGGP